MRSLIEEYKKIEEQWKDYYNCHSFWLRHIYHCELTSFELGSSRHKKLNLSYKRKDPIIPISLIQFVYPRVRLIFKVCYASKELLMSETPFRLPALYVDFTRNHDMNDRYCSVRWFQYTKLCSWNFLNKVSIFSERFTWLDRKPWVQRWQEVEF